jgi:hypothetical protein
MGCNSELDAYLRDRRSGKVLYESHDRPQRFRRRTSRERPSPVGLIAGDEDFWVLLATSSERGEAVRDGESPDGPPTRMCRAVQADGRLVLGDVDPAREQLLSEILETS